MKNATKLLGILLLACGIMFTSCKPDTEPEPAPTPTVAAPANLIVTDITGESAKLTWTGTADSYEIVLGTQPLTSTTTSLNVSALTSNTDYTWKVRARKGDNFSKWVDGPKFKTLNIPKCTVKLTAGDVWSDGTGYQMLLDATATAFGTTIPATGPLTPSGNVPATVYNVFAFKIPGNADGNLSTSNIVLNQTVTLEIPAGTYDYCITNPSPGERMWIASGGYGRFDDFVFEANKTYEFTVNEDIGNDMITVTVNGVPLPAKKGFANPTGSVRVKK